MDKEGTLTCVDGVYSNIADPYRPESALKVGNNINQYPRNVWTNAISGWSKQSAAAFNSGAECYGFSTFVDLDGVQYLLCQWGDKLYHYDLNTATATAIKTGLSLNTALPLKAIPCMRMYVPYAANDPYMIYTNGVETLKIVRTAGAFAVTNFQQNAANFGTVALGANLAAKTTAKPRFNEPFLDRMVFAGFEGQAAFDVLLTNSGDATIATQAAPILATDAGLFQLEPQLGRVTAVRRFKLSNTSNDQIVIIGQQRGVSIITGNDATDLKCITVTDEYGIPSNNCFVQIGSNVWFLASDGVRKFKTLVENANLINQSITYPVQDLAYRFNETQLYKAHAVHHKLYQEVQFWFPVDSDTVPSNAFLLSYNNDSDPADLKAQIFTKDGTTCLASIYFDKVFYGGNESGFLQKWHTGNLYDTMPVTSDMVFADLSNGNTDIGLQKLTIKTYGGGQKFIANASYLARGYDDSQQLTMFKYDCEPADYQLESSVDGGTVLGSWSLGNSAMPSEHMREHDYYPIVAGARSIQPSLRCNASDHRLDFMSADYTLEIGEAKNA